MPLYSDHYYYGSGQSTPYYSSPYTSSSRISSPYSFPYMSPISALLSAGIGANPVPRGLRSYSPMLSAISETGSPLMSRRDIGNHRSSPRHYYRQRPVVIDTDNLDLSKKKREDNEQVESTPGMISRAKTIVRMHTRKLKENPELKKKKTQAEILMEKYFIKEKPVKEEEELPRRKRIWEEREEELNNTPVRGGTIKRTNTVHKRLMSPAPMDETDVVEKPEEIIPIRKMSIDSELFKEEEALLDCMIQEELGLSNLKEMKGGDQKDEKFNDQSIVNRKKSEARDQIPYGRRKSSADIILDENGAPVGKRKTHMRKKKTSKPLPLDELNSSEGNSGSDTSSKNNKDETKIGKRRSTKKKKVPKFKIDSLLVEEKSSPKLLRKFQYEVIVEEGKNSDGSVKYKSIKHINKEDIPKDGQLVKEEVSVKSDNSTNLAVDKKGQPAREIFSSVVCDSECDTLVKNAINRDKTLTTKISDVKEINKVVSKTDIGSAEKKTRILLRQANLEVPEKETLGESPSSATNIDKFLEPDENKKQKTEAMKIEPLQSDLIKNDAQMKTKEGMLTSVTNKDLNLSIFSDKNKQTKSPQLEVKTTAKLTSQENLINNGNSATTLQKVKTDDNQKHPETTSIKIITAKQKSLTPDLGRKVITNISPRSEPNTPIMSKKPLLPKSGQYLKPSETPIDLTSTAITLDSKTNSEEIKLQEVKTDDNQKNILTGKVLSGKLATDKQKSLTPDLGRKVVTNITPKSEPNTPIMSKKQLLPKSDTIKTLDGIKAPNAKESTLEIEHIKNKEREFKPTTNINIDDTRTNEKSQTMISSDNQNKVISGLSKTGGINQNDLKKKSSTVIEEASKDEVSQFNVKNTKIIVDEKVKAENTLLNKNNQSAIKMKDDNEGLLNMTTENSVVTKGPKDSQLLEKSVDCNSNNVFEKPSGNKITTLKKVDTAPQIDINKFDGPGSPVKIDPNKVKGTEKVLTNVKNEKLEETIGKTKVIAPKTPFECNKTKLTPDNLLKSHQQKGDIIKKETDKTIENTKIPGTTSLEIETKLRDMTDTAKKIQIGKVENTKTEAKINKEAQELSGSQLTLEKLQQTNKLEDEKKNKDISKNKPDGLKSSSDVKSPTSLEPRKDETTGKPSDAKGLSMQTKDKKQDKAGKAVEGKQSESKPTSLEPRKDETTEKLTDSKGLLKQPKDAKQDKAGKAVEGKQSESKPTSLEPRKDETTEKLTDSKGLLKQPKDTKQDKTGKAIEGKQPESKPTSPEPRKDERTGKLTDGKELLKQPKDTKQDKTGKTVEVKQTESKALPKQPKLPEAPPKCQEKSEDKNKGKGNEAVSQITDKKDNNNTKETESSSKDQSIDKAGLDKEKTVKANKEKKKRIKSESDIVDDECSGETKSASKETDNKSNEKSQSLKEIPPEKISKKKKKSKDKDSSKRKQNTKSPRKIKESPKTVDKSGNKTASSESQKKTTSKTMTTSSTTETVTTVDTTGTTTTVTTEETENRELSKRSTRLLHFINKCMRLSEDDDNIFIDYSDEDESSSSSSEYTSDSEYSDSEEDEDTLTDDSSDECDVNCHRKCEKLMPNLCGVNQKLIVEALSSLRKGSSDREHGSPTRRQSNAALSLDDESPRGGTGGRVTPPATTIPKFRKYTMDDFQFLKVLGKGSFGKVLLAELRGTQYYYAVKCLKKDVVLEDDDVECTLIERKVLALGTNHPYLCHLFCTFQTESHLFFVMEYLNGGDLMFHIQQQGRFDEGRARFYAAEIVSGLKFLHKKGIVYRDLKLDNILLDFDGHVRIADFGMCKLQIYLDRTADTFCGTPDYMAPEIIKGLKYNQCVDWWSFGILMYEMLVGQSPFSGCDEDDLFWCICNRQPHYPRFITLEAKRILMQLLEKEASKRLGSCENGALEVMAHPFFAGLDWDRLERRELMPPFKPNVKHPLDVHYFDKHFTAERACLTPIDPSILQSMDQTQFQGFSYTNPNVTD